MSNLRSDYKASRSPERAGGGGAGIVLPSQASTPPKPAKTPLPLSGGRTPVPRGENLGHVSPRFCKVYSLEHGVIIKTHADNNGGKPTLWVDCEHTLEWGDEVHLGFVGGWKTEIVRESGVKPETRVDGYLPQAEVVDLIAILLKAIPPSDFPILIQALKQVGVPI